MHLAVEVEPQMDDRGGLHDDPEAGSDSLEIATDGAIVHQYDRLGREMYPHR